MRGRTPGNGYAVLVQTFLPYPEPRATAAVLDDRRLGKQRVETLQILRALTWTTYGWRHHPAVRMWRGFVPALVQYGVAICDEWRSRGRADAVREQLLEFSGGQLVGWDELRREGMLPPWLGRDALHASHQSALVRKDPDHYRALFHDVPDDLPYVWPDPAFPRWPLRRGGHDGLPVEQAAALLGLDGTGSGGAAAGGTVPDGAAEVVAALRRGEDVEWPDAATGPVVGLLAGLATSRRTAWVAPGDPLPDAAAPPAPYLGEPTGSTSASVARAPGPEDLAAMREEGREPEFVFLRPHQLDRLPAGVGLLVLDGVPGGSGGLPTLRLPAREAGRENSGS